MFIMGDASMAERFNRRCPHICTLHRKLILPSQIPFCGDCLGDAIRMASTEHYSGRLCFETIMLVRGGIVECTLIVNGGYLPPLRMVRVPNAMVGEDQPDRCNVCNGPVA